MTHPDPWPADDDEEDPLGFFRAVALVLLVVGTFTAAVLAIVHVLT